MKPVTHPLKLQMKRNEVGDLHTALSSLNLSIPEQEKNIKRFGASTRAAIRQFQVDHKLKQTGEVDKATARAINQELSDRGLLDVDFGPESGQRIVQGTVKHIDGTPLDGLNVRAFHRRLAGDIQLGQTTSINDGNYLIAYQFPTGLSRVDLFVRVFDDDKPAILAVSPIRIGAGAKEELNVIVSDEHYRGPSEFARAGGALSSQVEGVKLDDLDANDVALLVLGTTISRQAVTAWIASRRLAERTGIAHEALYGLVRTENTASMPRLLSRSSARLFRDLTEAARTNLISMAAGKQAKEAVTSLKRLAANMSASAETPSSLGGLLGTSSKISGEQQRGFLDRYARHEGPIKDLWQSLRKDPGFGDAVVDDLQFSLQLGTLTANHASLVTALRSRGLTRSSETAAFTKEDWREILSSQIQGQIVGAPLSIKGATEAERLDNYTTLLMERTALAFPTAKVTKKLKALPDWKYSTAVAFLDANPTFNLLTNNIRDVLNSQRRSVMRSEWDQTKLETELSTLQRVARVAPKGQDEAVVGGLLTKGYGSAFSITRKSRDSFVRHTAEEFGSESIAADVYRNAQFQTSRTLGAYSLLHPSLSDPLAKAIGGISDKVSSDATWSSLFGNVDFCSCEHCGSIYSPASYLVDLLAWLDSHESGGKTAFDRLDARRPDIKRIQLSCDNTNTVLPYVDLVNEILEDRILSLPTVDGTAVPDATTATTDEILADPEYMHPEVYDDHLAKEVYPWLLPFDLWGELGRVYFEHLGVRRSDLMETLARKNTPSLVGISAERLRLSMRQWRILTGAERHPVWAYWGYRSEAPKGTNFKIDLAVVSNFLTRGDLEYDDLLDLLHSRFANPRNITIVGDGCNTDDMTLQTLDDDTDLERMNSFLRLWRNRGWSLLDTDKALHALNRVSIDDATLHALADLDRLQDLTKAPLLDVLCWWSVIDTFEDRPEKDEPIKSLYQRVFLNRAVDAAAEQPDFPLALDLSHTALSHTVSWDEVRAILGAALRIDDAELSLLVDDTLDGIPNEQRVVSGTNATLEDLSALYRNVSLARAVKLTVSDLLGVLSLTGINPFKVEDTAATVRLIEAVDDIRASGFSLDELHYLHEHDAEAETRVGVTDEAISQTLVEIRDGLAAIENEFVVAADPNGEITARYFAVILDDVAASAVITALQTEADATNHTELAQILVDNLGGLFTFDAEALIARPVEQRFDELLPHLVSYLKETESDALVIEKLSTFTGRGLDSIEDLLSFRVSMIIDGTQVPASTGLRESPYTLTETVEITIDDDPEAFAALRRIYKASLVLTKLGIDIDEQVSLFDVGVRNGLLNPVLLPTQPQPIAPGSWDTWTRLVDLFSLRRGLPGGEPSLVELLQMLDSDEDPTVAEDNFLNELAARTTWMREDIDTLVAAFGFQFPKDWRDGQAMEKLVDAFALIRRAGVSALQADTWAVANIDAAQAEALRLAAKSKHDEAQWPAIARGLRDPVREKQRAALVAYLMGKVADYSDENDLYDDLLIDVEMDPCMLTSRIKQAISSVQLFVQRAFLNLEAKVEFTRTDRDQWEWMKNYRVWEANRKIFLYPENWIEPELRSTKSELFEQFENALLQGEVTEESVENAYTEYLEGLLKIARVEVMGMYHQFEKDEDGTIDILHVVARTKSNPHEYYYRQWVDQREWTPWEKLDADIDANHIVLALSDRRLYVFWPVAVEKAEGDSESTTNFFELKLAWIERLNDKWGARKLSTDFLKIFGKWNGVDFTSASAAGVTSGGEWLTYFRLAKGDSLTIECRQAFNSELGSNILGQFVMDTCTGTFNVDTAQSMSNELVAPPITIVQRMRFFLTSSFEKLGTATPLTLMTGVLDSSQRLTGEAKPVEVLGKVPAEGLGVANDNGDGWFDSGTFGNYIYPHQYGEFASQHGIFLDDSERTFHIMPETSFDLDQAFQDVNQDEFDPVLVGATTSQFNVFAEETEVTKFESELPWDQGLAVDIGERSSLSSRLQAKDNSAFEVPTAVETTAGALTNGQLQSSQNQLNEVAVASDPFTMASTTKYRFSMFYHPYVCDFLMELRRFGVAGLLDPNPDGPASSLVRQQKHRLDFFQKSYEPTTSVVNVYPIQDIDFEIGGAYADYNWEIFFHAPFLIANRLSQNQRFEEARNWYHFMFDPTNRSDDEDPLRFWKIKPFYREADAPISDFLQLAAGEENTPEAEQAREEYDDQIDAWLKDPFDPHAIARLRTTAYQKALVMKYLDNLLAWGDQLFRQDTIESINEATQLYVLALELLGDRPDALPQRSVPAVRTFEQVRGDLQGSTLNNPLVQLENVVFRPSKISGSLSGMMPLPIDFDNLLFSTSTQDPSFYFCIPPNDKLLGYWDIVEDRLFKIRHCMNIEGVVRQLPLFEPPIEPGMLVRARAAGVDLASALADLNAFLPHYRFYVMLQKAYSLNQSVRGLGGALLSALEKKDAEEMARLRANQEVALLEANRQLKQLAVDEARDSLAGAEASLEVVKHRQDYYQSLVSGGWLPQEKAGVLLQSVAGGMQLAGSILSSIAASVTSVPGVYVGAAGFSGSPLSFSQVVDGSKLGAVFSHMGQALTIGSAATSTAASVLSVTSGFVRRAQEWQNQLESAQKEIKQIEKQIDAANARLTMAEREQENFEQQLEQSSAVRELMESKFTNTELYQWMVGQISSLYFQSYQLAYDLAKQTERAYRHELALPDATFINFGYWDSLKKGLLAGDRLQYDLERMDKAYLENNRREYEITKHVSLSLLDPVGVLMLQTEGDCEFSIPEALFDLEYPGHYLRRIKSVGVSVPCITGPYTNVPAQLTLVSSRTRIDPNVSSGYTFDESGQDPRFQLHTGAIESMVISSGREDSGLFAPDLRDERYLPFEGKGVISDWRLQLTSAFPTFAWNTITDVVIHLRYTARDGGEVLRDAALDSLVLQLSGIPLRRGFSALHEFPTEWNSFLRPAQGVTESVLKLDLSEKRFPYFARTAGLKIIEIRLVALVKDIENWTDTVVKVSVGTSQDDVTLASAEEVFGGNPSGTMSYQGAQPGSWTISVPTAGLGVPSNWIDDLVVVATYEVGA